MAANKPMDYVPVDEHPLMTEECLFATKGIEDFCNFVSAIYKSRSPGGSASGIPRVGKSESINYFMRYHESFMGKPIPVFCFEMWPPEPGVVNTERRFYGEMLRSIGYASHEHGSAPLKRQRIVDFIQESCFGLNDTRALLFVDEAQNLQLSQYLFLIGIFNELRRKRCRLKVILVGQPELSSNIKKLGDKPQIRGRFMSRNIAFSAFVDKEDLNRVLMSCDTGARFPSENGWFYTEYFLPQAYAAGFRLSTERKLIWQIMCDTRGASIPGKQGEFTTQIVMDIVSELLLELSEDDRSKLALEEATIRRVCDRVVEYRLDIDV